MDENLAFAPATELRDLIAARKVSSVELTELYYGRIEKLDSRLNAYLTLTRDQAMRDARAADEAVSRGDELGPLQGVPISIKDVEMTRGVRTTFGSLVFKDNVPEEDSIAVERAQAAGAVMLGKTNTSEFGMLGANENRLGDHCRNPWNTDRTTGASSGGAGATIAAGLAPLAIGGDGGGSIRIPSSFCGIYGIKPTQNRVPKYGGAGAPSAGNMFGQTGPMTRTVRDAALLLQVIAGHDPRDPTSLREPVPDLVAAADKSVRGLRLGWSPEYGFAKVDPQVLEASSRAAHVYEELGCSLEEADLKMDTPFEIWWTINTANSYFTHGHLLRDRADELTWYERAALEDGAKVTGAQYAGALGRRDALKAQMADLFERYDLLLSPTMPVTAMPVGEYPKDMGEVNAHPYFWRFLPFTHPINTIGHPAATVPCGFDSDGLPIGLHIVGRPGDEATVIAASAAFENARPWADKRPPVS